MSDAKISARQWVVVRKDKHMKLMEVKPRQKEFIGRVGFTFDGAVGKNFGTSFEVVKSCLLAADPKVVFEATASEEAETPEETSLNGDAPELVATSEIPTASPTTSTPNEAAGSPAPGSPAPGVDNRNLFDRDENQRLGRDDIEEMRARGARGHEIVGHLVNNSLTFKGKTEYSREKYVNRKKKKHLSLLTILRPSTRLLCDMYYAKGPAKLCGMRLDSLTQMLLHTGVRSGANVMVVDSCLGLLVGAVMERLGGVGALVHFFGGSAPQKPAYVGYNFPDHFHDAYYEFPLERVHELYPGKESTEEALDETTGETKPDVLVKTDVDGGAVDETASPLNAAPAPVDSLTGDVPSQTSHKRPNDDAEDREQNGNDVAVEDKVEGDDGDRPPPRKKYRRDDDAVQEKRKMRRDNQTRAKELVAGGKMDALLFCAKYHPTPIVTRLLDFVAPSRPFVIFNQYREPLIDVYNYLKTSGRAVNLRLTESWMREYQVLPGRTHPTMQTSGGGGFLLTGFVVES